MPCPLRLSAVIGESIAMPVIAQGVQITPEMASRYYVLNDEEPVIERSQDTAHRFNPELTKLAHPSPGRCFPRVWRC